MTDERRRERGRQSNRLWRQRNPDKVKETNRKRRIEDKEKGRTYPSNNAEKRKEYRLRYLSIPGNRAFANHQANERVKALRRFTDEYKMSRGCVDCGFRGHPAALHFDHVIGVKNAAISKISSGRGRLNREIEKCVIRCANCHAIKTVEGFKQFHPRRKKQDISESMGVGAETLLRELRQEA